MNRTFLVMRAKTAIASWSGRCTLEVENEMLRCRLPEQIKVSPAERRRLLRFGRKLGTTSINSCICLATGILSLAGGGRWQTDDHVARTGLPRIEPTCDCGQRHT